MQAALQHINAQHFHSDGWIALASKPDGQFKQKHFRVEELEQELQEWSGKDVYFSQNTFYYPRRRIDNIRQLRALYVDIDYYKTLYTYDQIKMALELEYFRKSIPEPNYIINSGRGLVLVFLIVPVPHLALPRWQAVENYIVNQLKPLGADTQASDAARIFRLAGTVNSKNGATVTVEFRHEHRFELEQLKIDFLPELKKKSKQTRQQDKKIEHIFNVYTLHYNRLLDLSSLVKMRNYEMTGYRETTLFLYRYWSCCFLSDTDEALEQTLNLNSEFSSPLPKREVERATKSAEKAYGQWVLNTSNGTFRRGGYNYKNHKVIQLLDITPNEQKRLNTIISVEEKRRRNTIAKREKRRKDGVKDRDTYINEKKHLTENRLGQLERLINKNPSIKNIELAELLSISSARVSQLKKVLRDRE